ncbi:MAG: hypothetical protein PHI79_03485 [Sulfurovaceae bacterium]|nr:hypothetical protein [Sulfurovaceae bacterium]MDD5548644.1 hypothetical protein [Sulfurovaceae bacterium]
MTTVIDEFIFLEIDGDGNQYPEFQNWDIEFNRWAGTISKNSIIVDLEEFLKTEMHSTSISDEERDKLYARYLEMKLALFDKAVELAKTFARPIKYIGGEIA